MKEKLFIAAILLLCLVPAVGMLLPREAETGGNEVLAQPPAFRTAGGQLNADYLPQLMGYVEDNYFGRRELVSAWSAFNQTVLRTSIADNVVLGKDGWLYFGDTLNDYTGAELMTDREIFCAARNLALIQEFCERQGARFLFVIAPNKNSLYPEHMPELTVSGQRRNAQRLLEQLAAQRVPYVDLFSLFREQDETLYFTQDSHWNSKGAAVRHAPSRRAVAGDGPDLRRDAVLCLRRPLPVPQRYDHPDLRGPLRRIAGHVPGFLRHAAVSVSGGHLAGGAVLPEHAL